MSDLFITCYEEKKRDEGMKERERENSILYEIDKSTFKADGTLSPTIVFQISPIIFLRVNIPLLIEAMPCR